MAALRKVVIEIPRSHLAFIKGEKAIESWTIIQMLRSDPEGFAGVCRMKLRSPGGDNLRKLVGTFGITKIQSVSKEKDGAHIVYVEGKPMSQWIRISSPKEGYQSPHLN